MTVVASYSLAQIAARLGGKVMNGSEGRFVLAPGPGHTRKDRSLSVKLDAAAPDGFLVYSHCGDDPILCKDYVRERCGAEPFKPNGKGKTTNSDAGRGKPVMPSAEEIERATAAAAAAMDSGSTRVARRKIVATYDYRDADGTLLYQVLRYEPKTFSQRAADGNPSLNGVKRVLYHLPELIEDSAAVVFVTEGEKDADRIATLGLCATTISGGTKWMPEIVEPLRDRDVVIVGDFDSKGVTRALDAANALHGTAASIRMIFLPGLTGEETNKDVSDWLDQDPARANSFADLCLKAPLWTPDTPDSEVPGLETAKKVRAKEAPAADAPVATIPLIPRDAGDERELPPPRGWLLGNIFARRFVSSIIAEGGVGKTAVRVAHILSSATGRSLTGDHVFQRCRVLLVCLEDDDDELERRTVAARLHFGIERSELKGWLYTLAPGAAAGKVMELDQHGRPIIGDLVAKLEHIIVEKRIDLVCLDPFVKTHSVPENDNWLIDKVVQVLTDLASKYNIAIDTPHHTSKGPGDPGNASRGRGASSSKDAWRIVYSLVPMSQEEAQNLGVNEIDRRRLIRMDHAKVNIAPASEAKWFKLISINIGNPTDMYPNGDEVQTVLVWKPPDAFFGLNSLSLNQILNDIEAGLPDGNRYSNAPKADDRAAWKAIVNRHANKTEAEAKSIIKAWKDSGLLVLKDYPNPKTRKDVKGLFVVNEKRPS